MALIGSNLYTSKPTLTTPSALCRPILGNTARRTLPPAAFRGTLVRGGSPNDELGTRAPNQIAEQPHIEHPPWIPPGVGPHLTSPIILLSYMLGCDRAEMTPKSVPTFPSPPCEVEPPTIISRGNLAHYGFDFMVHGFGVFLEPVGQK